MSTQSTFRVAALSCVMVPLIAACGGGGGGGGASAGGVEDTSVAPVTATTVDAQSFNGLWKRADNNPLANANAPDCFQTTEHPGVQSAIYSSIKFANGSAIEEVDFYNDSTCSSYRMRGTRTYRTGFKPGYLFGQHNAAKVTMRSSAINLATNGGTGPAQLTNFHSTSKVLAYIDGNTLHITPTLANARTDGEGFPTTMDRHHTLTLVP